MDEIITSRKNPLIVRMAKLSDKKYRDAEGLFRFDGIKLFEEAVLSGVSIPYVFLAASKREKLTALLCEPLGRFGGTPIWVSDEVLDRLTEESAPQGIVVVAQKFQTRPPTLSSGNFRALWLSGVRDPGNLGTIIRTANAFGLDRVFISRDSADLYSSKVIRAAMGTIFRQPISILPEEVSFAKKMQEDGCTLYAATLQRDAKKLGSFSLPERVCFAVGNEGHGLDDALIAAASGAVYIPMSPGCESLNAAGAAGILSWEMRKYR